MPHVVAPSVKRCECVHHEIPRLIILMSVSVQLDDLLQQSQMPYRHPVLAKSAICLLVVVSVHVGISRRRSRNIAVRRGFVNISFCSPNSCHFPLDEQQNSV